jgi:DNA polymerase-3 subunit delta
MTEEQLMRELKAGVIRRIYFLHGKETFLTQSYAKRILDKCLDESERDFNLMRFSGNAAISVIAESVETLPVFAEKRVVMLNDFDVEKLDADSLEAFLKLLDSVDEIHESACIIIYLTGIQADLKKAKTKKFLSRLEKIEKSSKNSVAVNFDKITKIDEAIMRRVSQSGCSISRNNALLLARLCLSNYQMIICELEKLCAYANYKGEITQSSIERMTARQLDSGVFALAGEITAKRSASALKLLDELIQQGNAPVVIISSLSMTFIDFYRAKLGTATGKKSAQIVSDFSYPANRAWVMSKAIAATSRLHVKKLRECVRVLCDADYKLKSSPASMTDKDRIIMERAVCELMVLI